MQLEQILSSVQMPIIVQVDLVFQPPALQANIVLVYNSKHQVETALLDTTV